METTKAKMIDCWHAGKCLTVCSLGKKKKEDLGLFNFLVAMV